MIRQSAFTGEKRLLKGGLHCHTTRSDGKGSPEEVIRLLKGKGYDFLSITDHNIYNYKNYAQDVDITILPGMERDHRLSPEGVHVFHTVVLGPPKERGNGYEQDQRFEGGTLVTDQIAYQPVLDDFHRHGNLTLYCHPEWSGTPAHEFDRLEGNFAMEIWNSACAIENDLDTNAAHWDALLLKGKRVWGVATDDGHALSTYGHGWVRVNADNRVEAILEALQAGAFYASCGPEIYDFYVEDGVAALECSPCAYAGFRYGYMPSRLTQSPDASVTHAEFAVPPYCAYIRGVVKDAEGRRAWTNPIFLGN